MEYKDNSEHYAFFYDTLISIRPRIKPNQFNKLANYFCDLMIDCNQNNLMIVTKQNKIKFPENFDTINPDKLKEDFKVG